MMGLRRHVRQRDDGVVLILVGLFMVALLLIAALVIDYGLVRNTRQDAKAVADTTTTAALQSFATSDAKIYPWAGACAGVGYLRANDPDTTYTLSYGDGAFNPPTFDHDSDGVATVQPDPCATMTSQECVPNTTTTWAWIRATGGDKVVDIRAGYVTPDPAFGEDTGEYSGDNGEAARGFCDQLAVIVSDGDDAVFGGVAGATDYDTAIRTVGRIDIETTSQTPPAFLLLERIDCDVLNQQVGSGGGIAVEPPNDLQPGRIHLDSAGLASECTGMSQGAFTLYSGELGSAPDKFPGIRVFGDGTNPGQITMRAVATGNTARAFSTTEGVCSSWDEATGTCLATTALPGGIIGRSPVDDKYNPDVPGPDHFEALHADAVSDVLLGTAPAGFVTVSSCSGHTTTPDEALATHVFVDCPGGYSPATASFDNAQELIFRGPIDVAGGASLAMPVAERVVVGGNTDGGITTANGSTLTLNNNTTTLPTTADYQSSCALADTTPPARTSSLVIFGGQTTGQTGALRIGGVAAFCQTSVYLAGPKTTGSPPSASTYQRRESTDASYDPSCASSPCPDQTALPNAGLRVTGQVRWSAPNELTEQPTPGSVGNEDLALWMESAGAFNVSGELDGNGVFFSPNAAVQMQSPSTFTPRDAQFIARRLKLLQGSLRMKPTPANSILVDSLAGFGLVR